MASTLFFNHAAEERDATRAERELEARYVEVATGILSASVPDEEASAQEVDADPGLALRNWGTDVPVETSPVPIPAEVADSFRQGDVILEGGGGFGGGSGW